MNSTEKQKEIEDKIVKLDKRKEKKSKDLVNSNQIKAFEKSIELVENGIVNDVYYKHEDEAKKPKLSAYQKELLNSLIINKNGTTSINQLRAGKAILNKYNIVNNEKFLYKFDSDYGVWEKITKQDIRTIITKDLEENCDYYSDGTSRSITSYIYDKTYGNIWGETFDSIFNKDPYSVVFRNGTLNIKTGEFVEGFNADDYNTIVIPHNYNKEAKIPTKTINFLSMMISDKTEMNFVFEWFGYQMVKSYPITKMLFLTGDGGNGKSTLIKLMSALVGIHNTSAVSMRSLINNRFQSALLFNKLTNTVADIGADFFDDSSILKALTGDDHITIERKGENGFSYLNFAKMTYSCNKLPRFKDTTGGLNRRPIVLPLINDFTSIVKDSGLNISDIINDTEEMENLVKYCTDKFIGVIKNNYNFTESEAMKEAKNDWLTEDPIVDFIDETFEVATDKMQYVEMSDFMGLYKIYCLDRNYKAMSQKNIVDLLKSNTKLIDKGITVTRLSNKGSKLKVNGIFKVIETDWNKI